ncbi:MAG: type II toxin-antitoxin system Phd/YefM family antitoxin [Nitrospirae bacterium]|nr:type II toxin-antitoxin system Phd/YefM family antitoxin [Nitrospirota bacterium]
MIRINIHEAKTHLSRYLAKLQKGETILVCRRNQPIAEIRPLPPAGRKRRLGGAKGLISIPPAFFEPLPENLLAAFTGPER